MIWKAPFPKTPGRTKTKTRGPTVAHDPFWRPPPLSRQHSHHRQTSTGNLSQYKMYTQNLIPNLSVEELRLRLLEVARLMNRKSPRYDKSRDMAWLSDQYKAMRMLEMGVHTTTEHVKVQHTQTRNLLSLEHDNTRYLIEKGQKKMTTILETVLAAMKSREAEEEPAAKKPRKGTKGPTAAKPHKGTQEPAAETEQEAADRKAKQEAADEKKKTEKAEKEAADVKKKAEKAEKEAANEKKKADKASKKLRDQADKAKRKIEKLRDQAESANKKLKDAERATEAAKVEEA